MRVEMRLLVGMISTASLVAACDTGPRVIRHPSTNQLLYEACAAEHAQQQTRQFLRRSDPRALVAGVSATTLRCVSNDPGTASTTDAAIRGAMERCQASGEFFCEVFATDRGLSDWSKRISDNGGTDGSR